MGDANVQRVVGRVYDAELCLDGVVLVEGSEEETFVQKLLFRVVKNSFDSASTKKILVDCTLLIKFPRPSLVEERISRSVSIRFRVELVEIRTLALLKRARRRCANRHALAPV